MKNAERLLAALIGAAFLSFIAHATPASAWERTTAELFAVLPDGATGPEGLAVGPDGSIYIGSSSIRRVWPDGRITTIAGATLGYSGDGGPVAVP